MTPTRIIKGVVPPLAEHRAYSLTDEEAWRVWGATHAHLFDRMWIARSQGIEAHPHGVTPGAGPVFSRPIMNLRGMGMGARLIQHWGDGDYQAGYFWMPYLQGAHWSDDYVLVNGECVWAYRVLCHKDAANRSFVRFEGLPEPGPCHETNLTWIGQYMEGYTGVVNIETINGAIIEIHLRPNADFLTFYTAAWLERLHELCTTGAWGGVVYDVADFLGATVIPIRIQTEGHGDRFSINREALESIDADLVALDFQNNVPLLDEPDDGSTWRLALVGDRSENRADEAAERLSMGIEVLNPPEKAKLGVER